ncbi:MAG: Exodeoxyribonuclease 7 small subunit [Chlamydiae bacterium]|nr:Exodeoxyribonuclease 7 small subunit [Chlamydiota bacterium]
MKGQTFEKAYERLENILEKMNEEQVSLDDALALYEEADSLIVNCQRRLNEAEQKIEILIKNREENQPPQTEEFIPERQSTLNT